MTEKLAQVASLVCDPEIRPNKPKKQPIRQCFKAGRNTVGTEAQLALPSLDVRRYQCVTIKANAENGGQIYIGRVGVTWKTGFELAAGDEIELKVDNLNSIYVVALRSEQGYCWLVN